MSECDAKHTRNPGIHDKNLRETMVDYIRYPRNCVYVGGDELKRTPPKKTCFIVPIPSLHTCHHRFKLRLGGDMFFFLQHPSSLSCQFTAPSHHINL